VGWNTLLGPPNIYDKIGPIFIVAGPIYLIILVIVTNIWQKLSHIKRKETLIVTNFWQLFSQIFGETLLIVTNIWRNLASFRE